MNPTMERNQEFASHLPARWLEAEFIRRKAENPSYSLRAYAKSLKVPPGRLSELLARKRRITPSMLEKLADRIGLSPAEIKALQPKEASSESNYSDLADDQFALIAEGSHISFLCLMETKDFRSDLAWIAKRLAISGVEARAVALRLERLGLITQEKGKWKRASQGVKTSTDVPSAALRRSHKETLGQAISALDSVPVELRDVTSISMAIDPAKLPLAKAMIREFRYRLAEVLEKGTQSEVYHLNVQLFPVSHKENRK